MTVWTQVETASARRLRKSIRDHWMMFLVEGIVLIGARVAGLWWSRRLRRFGVTIFLGWLFLISGAMGLVTTFMARHMPGFWWSLLSAALGVERGPDPAGAPGDRRGLAHAGAGRVFRHGGCRQHHVCAGAPAAARGPLGLDAGQRHRRPRPRRYHFHRPAGDRRMGAGCAGRDQARRAGQEILSARSADAGGARRPAKIRESRNGGRSSRTATSRWNSATTLNGNRLAGRSPRAVQRGGGAPRRGIRGVRLPKTGARVCTRRVISLAHAAPRPGHALRSNLAKRPVTTRFRHIPRVVGAANLRLTPARGDLPAGGEGRAQARPFFVRVTRSFRDGRRPDRKSNGTRESASGFHSGAPRNDERERCRNAPTSNPS